MRNNRRQPLSASITFRPYLTGKRPTGKSTPAARLNGLRIGYIEREFANAGNINNPTEAQRKNAQERQAMFRTALDVFRTAGATLEPMAMPDFPTGSIGFVLSAEAAAAFDDLTPGLPAIALKCGFIDNMPMAIMVTGRLYDEATVCRVALAYEQATEWHKKHPTL